MVPKHIQIEPAFNEVVRNCGGLVLEEALPYAPDFQNADYVFHSELVIAELKCLSDDNIQSESNLAKASRVVREGNQKGSVPFSEFDMENWKRMPKDMQTNLYRVFTANVKRRISKANKQIRETRENLGLSEYAGLLLIANDGVTSLNPASFIHAVQLALQQDFREIRHFVFFTVNLYAKIRGVSVPSLFWISFDMEDGRTIDPIFLDALGVSWRRHCCKKMGVSAFDGELEDMEGFWNAENFGRIPPES